MTTHLTINGSPRSTDAPGDVPLLWVLRDEIGLKKIMWSSDFPHPEGSWPNTAQYFKDNFGNFPEDDGRRILGENAIEFYGLDRQKLQKVANDIGPDASMFH